MSAPNTPSGMRDEIAELRAQLAEAQPKPCCFEWETCKTPCVPRASNWMAAAQEAERQLAAEKEQSACYLANWKATEQGYNKVDARRIEAERKRDEARKDAERGRYMLRNCAWHRGDEQGDSIVVFVPSGTDLSCVAMREAAIDAAIKPAEEKKP